MITAHSVRERFWTPREEEWRSWSETQFKTKVLGWARDAEWDLRFHIPDSRMAIGSGFPDLILAKPGRFLATELKTESGKFSEDQEKWIATFGGIADLIRELTGSDLIFAMYGWRPSDEYEIMEVLNRAA
jgi:hypothetical protein